MLLASLAVTSACEKTSELVVDIPFAPGTRSMIVGIKGNERLSMYALEEKGEPMTLASLSHVDASESLEITALYYAAPLERLLLTPGPLSALGVSGPSSRGRPLPPFDVGFVRTVAADGIGLSTMISSIDDSRISKDIRALRLPPACRDFTAKSFAIPGAPSMAGLVTLTASTALLVTVPEEGGPGAYYEVGAEGVSRVSFPLPDFSPVSVVRAYSGEIYMLGYRLADQEPEIRAGTRETGFRALPPPLEPPASEPDVPHGDSDEGAVYILDELGQVERFNGVSWTILGAPPSIGAHLAWSGPGQVIITDELEKSLIRVNQDESTVEFTTPVHESVDNTDDVNSVTALRWVPNHGVVAGTHVKGLYRRTPETNAWDTLLATQKVFTGQIDALAGYHGGVLYGGASAAVGQYLEHAETCAEVMLDFSGQLVALAPLESGVVAMSVNLSSSSLTATVLEDVSPPVRP